MVALTDCFIGLVDIPVTKAIESMKPNKSKQLAGYIFASCIALASSSPLFIGWLCGKEPISSIVMAVSKYGGGRFLGIRLCLTPAQDQTEKFG